MKVIFDMGKQSKEAIEIAFIFTGEHVNVCICVGGGKRG